uniref:Integrase catalytic domain-containing protein n=1 Tax=Tanacetum cinerariifolium TaxID=118510 RepID=A0A6L2JWU3_TANCI|nr:hypothetical protein [Tanacetum cinerariifolium]
MAGDDNNDDDHPETPNPSPPVPLPTQQIPHTNGNGPVSVTTDTNGMIKVLPPKTAEEVVARERERKARTTLLMALPEDHLEKFYKMADAKEMWKAIKSKFCGNDESKKMHKYLLKQQFEEIHGAGVSHEDANQKLLRSLPSSWSQVALIMRTKLGLDTLSFDDLYNNLRVFERNVKGTTASSSNTQNVAFVSAENTSSTNDVSTAYSVSSPSVSKSQKERSSLYTDEVIHSFFVNQSSAPQLDYNDLEDCKAKGNQDNRRRDAGYNGNKARDNGRRPAYQDDSKALVTINGEDIDWSRHVEEDAQNYVMMAYSSSNSGSNNVTSADESDSKPTEYASCESDSSLETTTSMPEPVENAPKVVYEPKVWTDAPLTEEYESDSDNDSVSNVQEDKEKPSFASTDSVKHVKTSRENVKEIGTPNHSPKIEKQNRNGHTRKGFGYAFTRKAFFVCGIFSHLIRDCDFHEKRMAKQAELTKSKNKDDPHRALKDKGIIDSGCSRSDNGTEFKNNELIEFCGLKGIKREYSNARTPQQNGVVERNNGTLIEAARTMLEDSFLPTTFWAEAVNTTCCVLNRVLVTKPQNKTPYELLTVGCSLNSKAFRVYNLETKRVEENLHVNFLENKPNAAGKGHAWMFDLDYLTNSMNYESVSVENQANKFAGPKEANNNAGIQANDDQSANSKEIDLHEEYFILPIWSAYSTTVKSSGDKIEKNTNFKTCEKPVSQVEQIFLEELEKLKRQEKKANVAARKETTHENQNAHTNSTNLLNNVSTPLSVAGPSRAFNDGNLSYLDDRLMPHLEDIYASPSEGIFTDSSYDDEGVVTDFNNLETTVNVSPTLITRIHTIHPKTQILGDHMSAIQTRSKVNKNFKANALFQIQKVWILVDLPFGKKAIGTKWVYRNKKDERGVVVRNKARLVAQGHRQEEGIDYDEVFAPKEDSIFISQDKCVAEILKKFDFLSVKTASTPIETQKPLVKDEEATDVDVHFYRSIIGSLMYLTVSRPDIMFAVCACSRFQAKVSADVQTFVLIEAQQHSSNESPLLGVNTPRCDEDSLELKELMYALIVNPTIYVSCIKQFWVSATIKKVNDVVKLRALIDGKRVVVTEDVIRQAFHLYDADGVECLPNEEIFTKLARMGYEKLPPKLTFHKAFFSAQWEFLIHTLV